MSAQTRPLAAVPAGTIDLEAAWRPRLLVFALACMLVAGVCAQILAWAAYTGDDINTLAPVARHSLMATITYYIRPIEYYVVVASNAVWLPLWVPLSALVCAGAAFIHVHSMERFTGRRFERLTVCAIVAGNPVWFYAISQVDTVSQSLCNLAFAVALNCLVRVLEAPARPELRYWYAALNVSCSALLFTKELAIGAACVLPMIGLWQYMRYQRMRMGYVASAILFALCLATWLALKFTFKSQMPEASGHYNLSPSLADIARNVMATLAFGVTPLPTCLLSVRKAAVVWTVCGSIAALLLLWACSRLEWRRPAVRWWGLAMLGTCAPMFYVHTSELYASMIATLFVTLLVARFRLPTWGILTYCAALLSCSYINAYVYYHGTELAQAGVERLLYSVYYGPNGQSFPKHEGDLACPVGKTASVAFADGALICRDEAGRVLQTFLRHHSSQQSMANGGT